MTLEIRQESFDSLRTGWLALEDAGYVPTPFQTIQWVELWWKYYGTPVRQALLLGIYDGTHLIGIAPFFKQSLVFRNKIKLFDYLTPMGSRESSYNGILFVPGYEEKGLEALLLFLKSRYHGYILRLVDLPASSKLTGCLTKKLPFICITKPDCVCPISALPATWQEYWAGIGKSTRKKLKWYANRLEQKTGVVFEKLTHYDSDAIGDLFNLHYTRWGMDPANPVLVTLEKFERDLMQMLAAKGQLRLYFLSVAGKRIAGMFMYDYQSVRYYHKGGYDTGIEEVSPGVVLLKESIKDAIESGLHRFDFLRGDETYKSHFADTTEQISRVTLGSNMFKIKLFDFLLAH